MPDLIISLFWALLFIGGGIQKEMHIAVKPERLAAYGLTIVDLIDMPSIGNPEPSPDGTQILYTRTDADWDENGTITHIWRVNDDGTGTVQMTNGERIGI